MKEPVAESLNASDVRTGIFAILGIARYFVVEADPYSSRSAEFREDNHFLPQMYLKGFARPDGKVYTYRTLVSHPKVPM